MNLLQLNAFSGTMAKKSSGGFQISLKSIKFFEWSVVHALPAKTKSLVGVIERTDRLPLTRATIWKENGQLLIALRMPESEPAGAIFYYFTQASEGFEIVTVSSTGDKRWAIDFATGELSRPQFTL